MFAPLMHARKDLKPVVVGKPNQILMDSVRHTSVVSSPSCLLRGSV